MRSRYLAWTGITQASGTYPRTSRLATLKSLYMRLVSADSPLMCLEPEPLVREFIKSAVDFKIRANVA